MSVQLNASTYGGEGVASLEVIRGAQCVFAVQRGVDSGRKEATLRSCYQSLQAHRKESGSSPFIDRQVLKEKESVDGVDS